MTMTMTAVAMSIFVHSMTGLLVILSAVRRN